MTERSSGSEDYPFPIAGPIRAGTSAHIGTSWAALAFTVLTAATVASAVITAPQWTALLFESAERVPAALATTAPSPVATAPPASALASAWVAQTGQPGITVGGKARIIVTFRNTGTATWRRGTPSEVRLGVVGPYVPAMAVNWMYPERPAAQSEAVVVPGGLATFSFEVRGTHPGIFRLHLRPVVDGVAWLTDQGVYVDVEVR